MKKIISVLLVMVMAASLLTAVSADGGGIIIESHVETLADAQNFFDATTGQVLAAGKGFEGSDCATNPIKANGQYYIKNGLLPVLSPNKTYHVTLLAKGAESDIAAFVFRIFGVTGDVHTYGGAAQKFANGWGAGDYYSAKITASEWTRMGFKFTTDSAAQNAVLQLQSDALKLHNAVLLDEYTVIEENGADTKDYTKPYIYGAKLSGAEGELKSGDKLTASANTFDANSNVIPEVSIKWMKSSDGKTWSEIKDETAAVSSTLNESVTYTASSEYTVSADDEGTVIKAVMTAKSTGAVSGEKAVSAETNEAGSLGQRKITVNITGSGSVSYGGTNVENGGSISVVYGSDAEFTLECDDSHMVSSVKFGGDTLSVKDGKVTVSGIKADGVLEVVFSEISLECFVAPNGSDTNSGTIDAPFATLERAQKHINELKALGKSAEGDYIINLRGGTYGRESTFTLTDADSGNADKRVIYKAYNGEKVVISGSKTLNYNAFKPIDGEMKNLLRSKTAREKVLEADLDELGLGTVGEYTYNIHPSSLNNLPVITYNGRTMVISRWPNGLDDRSWLAINCGDDYEGTQKGSGDSPMIVSYSSEIPSSWEFSRAKGDIYMTGIWYFWYNYTMTKVNIDIENKLITASDNGAFMDNAERKAQFWNVFEEIDVPGEWYIDREARKMYIYPYDGSKNVDLKAASLSAILVKLDGADYITFDGIEFTGSKGINNSSVLIYGDANHNTLSNCKIYGNEGYGLYIASSADKNYADGGNNKAEYCEIYDNGSCGAAIVAGNRYGDPPVNANNSIENSSVHDNGKNFIGKTQIDLAGSGISIAGCDIYNGPYTAIQFALANGRIENCSIHDINMNSTDMGAIYNGRDMSCLDNVVKNNHLFNMGYGKLWLPQYNSYYKGGGVFTDDGGSGMTVDGNIFGPNLNPDGFGFKLNGGMDNAVTNNIFIDTGMYVSVSEWATSHLNLKFNQSGMEKYKNSWIALSENKYWTDKYPVLKFAKKVGDECPDFKNVDTDGNTVSNNAVLYINSDKPEKPYHYTVNYSANIPEGYGIKGIETNKLAENASKTLFTDWENGNMKPTAEFYETFGINEIAYEKIGYNKTSKYAPEAKNLSVFADSDGAVKASYTYSDRDSDSEGNTLIEWFSANANSSNFKSLGKYGAELEITPELSGKKIRYEITPMDEVGTAGEKAVSESMLIGGGNSDKSALNAKISEAEILLNSAVIGTNDGEYDEESAESLKTAIADAKAVSNSVDVNQYQVDNAEKALAAAIVKFRASVISNAEYMSIAPLLSDPDGWTVVTGTKDGFENGTLTLSSGDRLTYSKEKFKNKLYTFNMEIGEGELGGAIYFGLSAPDKQIWESIDGYDLWLKPATLECQRWPVGKVVEEFANSYFKAGSKHKVSVGVSGTGDNQKFVLYVDGSLVYSKAFDGTISGEGYFGFGCTGTAGIVITPVEVDYTALDKVIAEAEALSLKETGTLYGQYPEDAMNALKDELSAAKALRSGGNATQESCEKAVLKLESAITALKDLVICEQVITGNESLTLNEGKPNASFTIENGGSLKLSKGGNEVLPEINISAKTANGNLTVAIPGGTKFSNDTFTAFSLPAAPSARTDSTFDINAVYEIGGSELTSDRLVKIVFPGAKNYKIAYKSGSSYKEINRKISENTESAALAAISGSGAVKYIDSNDVVVYTNILSEFIVYTKTSGGTDEPSETPGGGNGGGVTKPSGNKGTNGFYSGENTNPSISNPFTDMAGHWAAADVLAMNKAGIVSGVSDTLFDPDRNITRAEFAAIIARALKLSDKTADYKDVSDEWFAPYVGACSDAGIISGYDGMFRPNDNITRQEMAVIIVNAYSYLEKAGANGGIDSFTDKAEIADWAKAAVDTASSVGLISGMGDGTFAPNANATRAQAASIVRRLLG